MDFLITAHNVWRYVVLIAAVGALGLALLAYLGSRDWDRLADRFASFFTLAMDIQVLIGLLAWVFANRHRDDLFLTWIHPALMLGAVGLAHAGRALSERADGSKAKGRTATLFFGGSLIVVLVAIPLGS